MKRVMKSQRSWLCLLKFLADKRRTECAWHRRSSSERTYAFVARSQNLRGALHPTLSPLATGLLLVPRNYLGASSRISSALEA